MTRQSDLRILRILELHHVEGFSLSETAEAFGMSRSAVAGIVSRIRHACELSEPCICRKPENRDGGMPRRWWA